MSDPRDATVKELRRQRDEFLYKCRRLTKQLSTASQIAYQRGYVQGVQDATTDETVARAEARALAPSLERCGLSEGNCKAADCPEHGWL